jgi:predicted permease
MGFYPVQNDVQVADTPEQSLARGVAYVFIVTLVATFTRWTFLYRLLMPPAPAPPSFTTDSTAHSESLDAAIVLDENDHQSDHAGAIELCHQDNDNRSEEAYRMLASASDDIGNVVGDTDEVNIELDTVCTTHQPPPSSTTPTATPTTSRTMRVLVAIKNFICGIEVPAWAALVSVICGLIPSVRYILFESPAGYFKFFTDALTAFGDSVVPLTLLTLGVSMSEGPKPTAKLGLCTTLLILVTRLFVIPLFGILFLYLLSLASMLPLGLSSLINQPEHGDVLSL